MERILLAVSGGIDSMCLAEKSVRSGQDFAVAHCNFHLRGADSDAEADFVADWARRHGIAFYSKDFDTAAYAAEQGISLEMAARELRYGWFADLCSTEGFAGVAVAHQADDRRETFLLNLMRSSGGRGLRGMQGQSVIPGTDIPLLRPLLGMTRQEIETYMRSIGATWREDGSNRDTAIRRNCIRHEVMPLLSELNPSYGDALDRAMRHIGSLQDVADTWFESVRPTLLDPTDGSILLDSLRSLPHRDFLLYRLLEPYGLTESVLDDLCAALDSGESLSGKRFLLHHATLLGERNRLSFCNETSPMPLSGSNRVRGAYSLASCDENPVTAGQVTEPAGAGTRKLRGAYSLASCDEQLTGTCDIKEPGTYDCGGVRVKVEILDRAEITDLKQPRGILLLDAGKLPLPLIVRPWRAGDWLVPLGMRGRKKLSDLFVDLKYSILDKQRARVIDWQESRIAALLGERGDDALKVTSETRTVYRITIS
ncbi:MAG: tRNA lysidine(34) synthetase TilS [Bacteroidales bacterium]|nr:tRNA lysidine(34) synthetase TilS [Bacteroidales bacterium]